MYTAAGHKAQYYQILSNKISSIAEKKRTIFNSSGNVSAASNPSNIAGVGQSFQENLGSIPGSPAVSSGFSKPFPSPNVPNPQMLLMNTLGKGINQQQQQQQQQQPIKESSIYSSTSQSVIFDASSSKNPFIPAIPLSSKPQIHIPNGKPSASSSNSFYPNSSSLLNANPSSFHSVSPPSTSIISSGASPTISTSFQPPTSIHPAQQQTRKMQYYPTNQQQPQQATSQNEKLYAGSLPNLTLNSEEKNAVRKLIESLKAFIPKIEILITVSNSIGIPMENLKKISNLKDILVKQLELFKSDIYLLSPFMAENLAEHIRKFVSLLLHKVNSHPAAQSIIEKIRKASEANGTSTSSSSSSSSNANSSTNSILPSPLSLNVPFGSSNNSSSSSLKKGSSPAASSSSLPTTSLIRESPFKAPSTATNGNANSFSTSTSNTYSNVKSNLIVQIPFHYPLKQLYKPP